MIITGLPCPAPGMGNNYSHSAPRLSNDPLHLFLAPGIWSLSLLYLDIISRLNILETFRLCSQFNVPLLEVNPAAS